MAPPSCALYDLQILLPSEMDAWLRGVTAGLPFATWASWGPHVTLIPEFHCDDPGRLERDVERVCDRSRPLTLKLRGAIQDRVSASDRLEIVMLVFSDIGERTIAGLRSRLASAAGLSDEQLWPEASGGRYRPHISLTRGLSPNEATQLKNAACAIELTRTFTLEEIWLLRHETRAGEETRLSRVGSFKLGVRT